MKNIFKPEDFDGQEVNCDNYTEMAAKIANEKLNSINESRPIVYGNLTNLRNWTQNKTSTDTHQARLAFIEEIKQEPEEYYYVESGFTVNNEPMYKRVKK